MFLKIFKKTLTAFLTFLIMPFLTFAYSDYIIASGENVGIQLNSDGIMVVGVYEVNKTYPAIDAGIEIGDKITSINEKRVTNINEMVENINNSNSDSIKIGYIRNDIIEYTNLKLYRDLKGICKTGLYVKDSISGIGTLTFIDPNTKTFGALGHEITEKSTGKILDIKDGKIFESSVTSIEKSDFGSPGEKNAKLITDKVDGNVEQNTTSGIFGKYTKEIQNKKLYKVASVDSIKKGDAKILTVINNQEVDEFDIKITKIFKSDDNTKNLLFEVTDKRLLEKTGGIVQGMSGSPIIQGENIVGAVTHVVVDTPTKGYGIFITNMLEEAED